MGQIRGEALIWDQQTKRVNDWLDKTELYKTRPKGMTRASARHSP